MLKSVSPDMSNIYFLDFLDILRDARWQVSERVSERCRRNVFVFVVVCFTRAAQGPGPGPGPRCISLSLCFFSFPEYSEKDKLVLELFKIC